MAGSLGNYATKYTKSGGDIWNSYGCIISGPAGTLKGLFIKDISLSSGMNVETPASATMITDTAKAVGGGILDGITKTLSKLPVVGNAIAGVAQKIGNEFLNGATIAESINLYQNGEGRFNLSVDMICVPGMFGFGGYQELENFATKATLPKNVGGFSAPYSQYLYSPMKRLEPAPNLDGDLFSLNIVNKIIVPGGLYVRNVTRNYSQDVDERGIPIYCQVTVELEYYRQLFADEFAGFVKM